MSLGNKLAAMYANKFTSGIIELDPQSSIANIVKGTIPDMGRPAITSGKLVISARTFCLNLPKIIGEVNRGNAEEFLKLFGVECAGFFNFSRGKI
ncbi:MAG: hypothetical protein LBB14_01615, partial [Puniceicoccales bacterium]|nr:hypothetical protein [Puniceicoccales bacterium]